MKKQVLISGASFAGLTLAYWLNKFGYQVTIIEVGKSLRKGGSPIDVRGQALDIITEMGIYKKIKDHEFVHTDEIVNSKDETLASFSINQQAEYLGDIEIHRGDLIDIIYELLPKDEVEIIFGDSIATLVQHQEKVDVTLEKGLRRSFDFVFGADGTHSIVRKLVFGPEENFKKFFGVYFAFAEAAQIQTGRKKNTGVVYRELGKQAVIYQFKDAAHSILMFRAPKLDWNYRNPGQQKEILKEYFGSNQSWKIPEILASMLQSDNLYFDEASQIHMPAWTKGRIALIGDAAHAPSFFTGMGTSLAMQGATLLAKELHANDDYNNAFEKYNETFKPIAESIQAHITRGLKVQLPETEDELQASIKAWSELSKPS